MKKKIMYIILTTILLTLTSTVYGFSDVEGHWASDAILKFNEANLVKGYGNDEFRPNDYITRAEVAAIINRMNGTTKESLKYIPDITRDDWYYSDIRKAVQSNVMQGDEKGYTRPNSYITREEAVVMLARAFKIDDTVVSTDEFKDEKEISTWAKKTMETFIRFKYITGYDDETIRPKSNITRAELVTIINRLFTKIATTGIYEGSISGSMLVVGKNVVLNDLTVNGNLILAEGIKETLVINDVKVKGDLLLREEIDASKILCSGRRILLYLENDETYNKYQNKEYGIEFSIPNGMHIIEKWRNENIDFKKEDLIIVDITMSDDYYLKSVETIGKEEIKKVDNIYRISESGKIKNSKYILYEDFYKNIENNFLIIKRENVIYKIWLLNAKTENLVDNIIGTLNLYETDKIKDRDRIIYKNNKLNIKFSYRDGYIGVDDSYNTGKIYSGDATFKLFIQVNTITDINEYSFNEVIYLLRELAKQDGELKDTETFKILNKDAVKFEVSKEDKETHSLYIVYGNILYNFIFVGETNAMNEIGEELFNEVIKSLEI